MGHLERIREAEWGIVRHLLPPQAHILEIGGGGGFQASLMAREGFDVTSLDTYPNASATRYFEVLPYDGVHLPFESETFDVVYSSNALEHVERLEPLLSEMKRVLKREGIMLHLVPSPSWRFWTILAHYAFMVKCAVLLGTGVTAGRTGPKISDVARKKGWLHVISRVLFPGPHGQDANALVELVSFSKRRWIMHFLQAGWHTVSVRDTSLFYTGYQLMPWLPMGWRRALGRILGGACHVFVLSKGVRSESR